MVSGGSQDDSDAVHWFKKAAGQGNAEAQFNVGIAYLNGDGVWRDEEKAFLWLSHAAANGVTDAQFNIGYMNQVGIGTEVYPVGALYWLRMAAQQGHAQAQNDLGRMLEVGDGIEPDKVEAYMWYSLSASGHPPGEGRDRSVGNRDDLGANMTASQLMEAHDRVAHWQPSSELQDSIMRR